MGESFYLISLGLDNELKNNQEFMLKALEICKDSIVIQYASEALKNDPAFILKALEIYKSSNVIDYASEALKNDPAFILKALEICQNGCVIQYASEALRNDAELILKACEICKSSNVIHYVSNELKNDAEFMWEVVKFCKDDVPLGPTLVNSLPFMQAAIKIHPNYFVKVIDHSSTWLKWRLAPLAIYEKIKRSIGSLISKK